MSEMVERVARVIANLITSDESSESIARAAIEAMREPTEAMVHAGWEPGDWDRVGTADLEAAWRAMIDAALK